VSLPPCTPQSKTKGATIVKMDEIRVAEDAPPIKLTVRRGTKQKPGIMSTIVVTVLVQPYIKLHSVYLYRPYEHILVGFSLPSYKGDQYLLLPKLPINF